MSAESRPDPQMLLEHAARVRALARALVLDPHEALDIEQTAWRRALESRSTTFGPAWLSTIVRNVARSRWREHARRREREHRVARERAPIPSPAEVLEREELRRRLVEHVLALDEPWRTTLVLHYLEERVLRDVAAAMGVPLDTARARVKRGLELLRTRLRRESGPNWALSLVSGFDLEFAPLSAAVGGVLAVGAGLKVGVAAALGVAVVGLLLTFRGGSPATPVASEERSTLPIAIERSEGATAGAHAVEAERAEAVATPAVEVALAGAPKSSGSSVAVRVLWAEGRAPASDIWIELRCFGDRVPELQLRRARTDRAGEVRFEEVSPGRVVLRADRGLHRVENLGESEHKELELVLEPGVRLIGDVVDEREQPVAGAEIWIDGLGPDGSGFPVATSDAAGRFEVRDLERGSLFVVGARAPGRAPTFQHFLNAPASDEVRLRLAFNESGAALRVVVLDALGKPVPEASVYLGVPAHSAAAALPAASHMAPAPPLRGRTDAVGEARFDGAKLGRTPLHVRATDLAPWSGEVELGSQRSFTVTLERGAVLRGRVADAQGAPVSNVRVAVGTFAHFTEVSVNSKRDGSFELYGLPTGEFTAVARAEQRGSAEQTFHALPGAELEWNAQLSKGGVIRGRVVAPGLSLTGWCVAKLGPSPDGALRHEVERVAADGSFEFSGCDDAPVTLHVLEAPDKVFELATVRDVRPSDAEVLIEIDPARRPSVRLRGRVLDENGAPLSDVDVNPFAFELGPSPTEHVDPANGRFELGPYPSADWGLVLVARDRPTLRVSPRKVAPDEIHDFGDLVMGRGGVLALSIVRDANVVAEDVEVCLEPMDGQLVDSFRGRGARVRSHPIAPGRFQLQAFSSDGFSDSTCVKVVSGGETALEVRLRLAARWSARILDASGAAWNGAVSWMATDANSQIIASGFEFVSDGKLAPSPALPAGAIEVLVVSQDGQRSAVCNLAAELAARAAAPPFVLTLR